MKLFDVYPVHPINIVKAEGSYVWDNTGIKYLDLYGGHAVISIGHTHPHWVKRIEEQLHHIAFYSNSVQIPLQQELADLFGKVSGKNDYQLFLCNSGAEANENALKLASFATGRKRIISFTKAFHGRTSLAVAVTDNASIQAPVNENPHITILPFNDENVFADTMDKIGHEVAAVIIEGIQGVGGIQVAEADFIKLIRKKCDEYGSVFIADEVQCGYGRTGKFFSLDHTGISADIYSMAKGMGNGFPVAGIAITPEIAPKHFMLGTTFGGNHLACAAAIAVLEVLQQENLMQHASEMGDKLVQQLSEKNIIKNVRGKGLMIGFDVPETYKDLRKNLLNKHHLFTGEAKPNVIRLLPALSLPESACDQFIKKLDFEISYINQKNVEAISVSG